jgi:hypothetical protein
MPRIPRRIAQANIAAGLAADGEPLEEEVVEAAPVQKKAKPKKKSTKSSSKNTK